MHNFPALSGVQGSGPVEVTGQQPSQGSSFDIADVLLQGPLCIAITKTRPTRTAIETDISRLRCSEPTFECQGTLPMISHT